MDFIGAVAKISAPIAFDEASRKMVCANSELRIV
jgi:hypothetical protein